MSLEKLHNKYYKILLLIPVVLLISSFIYIGIFYKINGDFFYKDISLTGGTSATINGEFDVNSLKSDLSLNLDDLSIRNVYDLISNQQKAVIIETKSDADFTKNILENYLGYNLTDENSSFEYTGSVLSQSFYKQLVFAILLAFIFMSIVVFILFRTLIPSSAVIISAFADIVMTLAFVNILGIKLSTAGIVAFLMLIGYSVDTDILLTTRILKRSEGDLNKRIFGAFKTGMTMTLTSILAVTFALILVGSFSVVLNQIFTILIIGLFFDIINTWITNVSILKWYVEKIR
jgi:preprotein translocase subunit SecF